MKIMFFLLVLAYGCCYNITSNRDSDNNLIIDLLELNGYDLRYPIIEENDYKLYKSIKKSNLLPFLKIILFL